MTRLCERPGCSEPGCVAYELDRERRTVTLHAALHPDVERAGVLCRRHADAMVVPRGWSLDDRRDPVPRLFRLPPATTTADQPRLARPRPAAARGSVEPPALFDEDEPTVAEVAGPTPPAQTEVDETVAMPWRPHFDVDDDLDGLLAAETPLLARAFGTARRRPRRR